MKDALLKTSFAGLQLGNPTALASGILGYTGDIMQSVADNDAGAIVTKSVGVNPRMGYANPTITQTAGGLINAMGLPNPGINEYTKEITYAKSILQVPLIVSIYGYSAEEYALVAKKAVAAGADAVELNVSCPHVKYTGSEIGGNLKLLRDVIYKVKSEVTKPVIVKLSPNVTDIVELADTAVKAGADALTVINTVRAIAIDVETSLPILTNIRGGLSGPAIKPIALRCVYDISECIKTPIMGCGGISNWRDAAEFLLAGASTIQVGTAIAMKSPRVFREINKGLKSYLRKKGYKSVNEIVGKAHRA